MRAMILAAGRGERMRGLTATRPKPLLEVAGRSLIERHLEALAGVGVREVIVNVARLGEQVRAALGDGSGWQISIRYSDEGPEPLETGGGIIRALPLLGTEPFLLVNADVVTDLRFDALVSTSGLGTLVLVDNPPHHGTGDFGLAADGRLTLEPPLLTYAGIALLDPSLFDGWPQGRRPLRPILEAAIRRGALRGLHHRGLWIDVGTPERLAEAERALRGTP